MNDLPVSPAGRGHLVTAMSLSLSCSYQVGRSVDETLRLVQAFQFTDEEGEGKGWES